MYLLRRCGFLINGGTTFHFAYLPFVLPFLSMGVLVVFFFFFGRSRGLRQGKNRYSYCFLSLLWEL
jgi:hypothetical protein